MTHAEYGAQMAAANLGKLSKENQKAIQLSGKQAEKKGWIFVFTDAMDQAFGKVASGAADGRRHRAR